MPESIEHVFGGGLFGVAFEKLLRALDSNHVEAGEKYVELCFKLRKFFAWKQCDEASIDKLVDETIDRVAKNLLDGAVIENINSYSHGVARRVWLEYLRKPPKETLEDDPPDIQVTEMPEEMDKRYDCLDRCLANLKADDRNLILGYYDIEEDEKNKDNRKGLAQRFGKSSGALKVYATRLREKLRRCITECLKSEL